MNDFQICPDYERNIWVLQAGARRYTVGEVFAVLQAFLAEHDHRQTEPRADFSLYPGYAASVVEHQKIGGDLSIDGSRKRFAFYFQIFIGEIRQSRLRRVADDIVGDGLFPDFATYRRMRFRHWLLRKRLMGRFFGRTGLKALCH